MKPFSHNAAHCSVPILKYCGIASTLHGLASEGRCSFQLIRRQLYFSVNRSNAEGRDGESEPGSAAPGAAAKISRGLRATFCCCYQRATSSRRSPSAFYFWCGKDKVNGFDQQMSPTHEHRVDRNIYHSHNWLYSENYHSICSCGSYVPSWTKPSNQNYIDSTNLLFFETIAAIVRLYGRRYNTLPQYFILL